MSCDTAKTLLLFSVVLSRADDLAIWLLRVYIGITLDFNW